MNVTVRFFASLREAAGTEQEQVNLPPGASVQMLLQALVDRYSSMGAQLGARGVRFAVNRCYAQPDVELKDGDEVALVPPVGGG